MSPLQRPFTADRFQNSVQLVAEWTRCIGSRSDAERVLSSLTRLIRAECILVFRHVVGVDRAVLVAHYDSKAGLIPARPMRSFANELLCDTLQDARPGSVVSAQDNPVDMEVSDRLRAIGIRDTAAVVLENSDLHFDYLEILLDHPMPDHDRMLLEILGSTLADCWQKRPKGSVQSMLTGRMVGKRQAEFPERQPLLSSENPIGLTRSEFRICAMMKEGMLADEITTHLKVSKSTFRTHLRAIFLKTGAASQVELLHMINASRAA